MASFLTAIQAIVQHYDQALINNSDHANRMNAMGVALEDFIKDSFADSFTLEGIQKRAKHQSVFSYTGNQNNPPDMMLKGGDAIELFELDSIDGNIVFNSLYPKAKLLANSSKINSFCRSAEDWQEKDLIYAIGTIEKEEYLRHLWLIYGDCFVANATVYERIIKIVDPSSYSGVEVDCKTLDDIGCLGSVDYLNVTKIPIRSKCIVDNPTNIFSDVHTIENTESFQLSCLITKEKFNSLPESDRKNILSAQSEAFTIVDVEIRNPNHSTNFLPAKLLHFKS
jgi:hypothetical protein